MRAAAIRANPFDETLKRYSIVEDLEASFAAMQHGCLVGARNARISGVVIVEAIIDKNGKIVTQADDMGPGFGESRQRHEDLDRHHHRRRPALLRADLHGRSR